MKRVDKKELKKLIKLPKSLSYLYDIPLYIKKRKRYSYLLTIDRKETKKDGSFKIEIFDAGIVVANKHTKPLGQFISTICHEWAHYICIENFYDFRHSKRWTKVYKKLCPKKEYWVFEKKYLKKF